MGARAWCSLVALTPHILTTFTRCHTPVRSPPCPAAFNEQVMARLDGAIQSVAGTLQDAASDVQAGRDRALANLRSANQTLQNARTALSAAQAAFAVVKSRVCGWQAGGRGRQSMLAPPHWFAGALQCLPGGTATAQCPGANLVWDSLLRSSSHIIRAHARLMQARSSSIPRPQSDTAFNNARAQVSWGAVGWGEWGRWAVLQTHAKRHACGLKEGTARHLRSLGVTMPLHKLSCAICTHLPSYHMNQFI